MALRTSPDAEAVVNCAGLLAALERDGLLLLADAVLPSVASLVAGGAIRGSWWGHPRGADIYRLSNELAESSDVMMAKLVSGKVTYVHRRLWPALVGVGQSRESWQTDALSEADRALLGMVDEAGTLAWDDVPPFLPPDGRAAKDGILVLEGRLLIHAQQVHTPTGAHAKNLQTWAAWAAGRHLASPFPDAAEAKQQLEATLDGLNAHYAARARLPWRPRRAGLA
jgi:hypothetical protein